MVDTTLEKEIILIADPRITVIAIIENDEPLVELREQTAIAFGPSPEIPNNTDYTKMRKTVYEKLLQAQSLLPVGVRFCLYEAYRSLALQKMLFDNRFHRVTVSHPTWTHEQCFDETMKLVSPVINKDGSENIPPHATGAAVDIYLIDTKGEVLDMGMHPKDWVDDLDGTLSMTECGSISKEAQANRTLMATVLSKVGFVNYSTEYWHWSYGDRYWAYFSKRVTALYGKI